MQPRINRGMPFVSIVAIFVLAVCAAWSKWAGNRIMAPKKLPILYAPKKSVTISYPMAQEGKVFVDKYLKRYQEVHGKSFNAKETLKTIDPYVCWQSEETCIPRNLLRAMYLLESAGNPKAIDSVFLSGQVRQAHLGFAQMAAETFAENLGISSRSLIQREVRAYSLIKQRKFGHNELQEFYNRDPRFNLALSATAAKNYLKAHLKLFNNDALVVVQSYHNGVGNIARQMRIYGWETNYFLLPADEEIRNSVLEIQKATKLAMKSGFNYQAYWEKYYRDADFQKKIDDLGLRDDATRYGFKVAALALYLEEILGQKPINGVKTSIEIEKECQEALG